MANENFGTIFHNGVSYGGSTDTSALANKSDVVGLQLTGTKNSTGSTITSGTWFYLNGVLVKATTDIANGATFTKNTNYVVKTVGEELSELNSNMTIANNHWYKLEYLSTDPFTFNPSGRNFIALVVDVKGNMAASIFATYNASIYSKYDIKTSAQITITMPDNNTCSITHTYSAGLYVLYF